MHLIHHHFGFHPLDNTNSSKQPNIFQYFTTCSHFLQKMKAFYVFAAVVLAVLATAEAKSFSTLEKHPIDWYNCVGVPDGNYEHPWDCTRFISCSGHIASERDCANCTIDAVRCPTGRLVYNSRLDTCLWADETTCSASPSPSTAPPTTAPTSTAQPSSASPSTPDPTTASPSTPDPTTASPTTTDPTTESPTTTDPTKPKPGDVCDPQLCKNIGYCLGFLKCDEATSTLVYIPCGKKSLWNPLNPLGLPHVHGGICDDWDHLHPVTQEKYRRDRECLGCYWNEIAECSDEYEYQAPNGTWPEVQHMKCSPGFVFVKARDNCQRCEEAKKADGTMCC